MIEKIQESIYTYDPNEYMPIYEDGELANRSAFIAYKLRRSMQAMAAKTAQLGSLTIEGMQRF